MMKTISHLHIPFLPGVHRAPHAPEVQLPDDLAVGAAGVRGRGLHGGLQGVPPPARGRPARRRDPSQGVAEVGQGYGQAGD